MEIYSIPLKFRRNQLFYIQFKSIYLSYSDYSLEVSYKNIIKSSRIEKKTMFPRFQMHENSDIDEFFREAKYSEFILRLRDENKNEILEEFRVSLNDLIKVGKNYPFLKIKSNFLVLFNFSDGYFITKDIYYNIFSNLSPEQPLKVKFFSFFKYNEKAKEWDFFNNQNLYLQNEVQSHLKKLDDSIKTSLLYEESLKRRLYLKDEIIQSSQIVSSLQQKILYKENLIKSLQKLIAQKKSDLNIARTVLKNNTSKYIISDKKNTSEESPLSSSSRANKSNSNYKSSPLIPANPYICNFLTPQFLTEDTNKIKFNNSFFVHSNLDLSSPYLVDISLKEKEEYEKTTKKVEKFKVMLAALKNKKLAEVTFVFFNNICDRFYLVPVLGSEEYKSTFFFYERHYKEISVMTGVIAQILNYLSTLFNIPLKYPLVLNGSKSYIVKNKKDFLKLSYSYKNEENRVGVYEISLSCLQSNLYEINRYLRGGVFPKSNNFFKEFVKFYEICMEVILIRK